MLSQRLIYRLTIVFVIVCKVVAFMVPRNRAHPMSDRTFEAFQADAAHHSPATQSALEAAIDQDVHHNDQRHLLAFSPFLAFDCVLIYFFWNRGVRKTMA
jgi:hypothetical protein